MDKILKGLLDDLAHSNDSKTTSDLAEKALHYIRQEDNPMLWANLHGTLGASLVGSASGRFTNELYVRVLASYEAALSVYSPEKTPDLWGWTQRNVGATHLGAAQCGIGDVVPLVDAAIVAYEKALDIPFNKHNPSIWLQCQKELAAAFEISAMWRGPSAFVQSARALDAALTVVTKDISPEIWAMLKLRLGSNLSESGASEFTEEAIQACEDALRVLHSETAPLDWARAHLVIGGLYRTRGLGRRDENLERATSSLNHALSIFTREATPEEWFRAHYHRGPAYLFRVRGDHGENVEQALESLHIAINLTPREQDAKTWASLLVALGQGYQERSKGEREDNLDFAVAALESALEFLAPDPLDFSWVLANRYLGYIYLERKRGNHDENTEKAIAALNTVQQELPTPDKPDAWCAAQVNLAQAYMRRVYGNPDHNRLNAIKCFEAALSVPSDAWDDTTSWFAAQANLALLYLDSNAVTIGKQVTAQLNSKPPVKGASTQGSASGNRSDPFDLAGQAREIADALEKNFLAGEGPLETDPDWHIPPLLNEEASLMQHHFRKFLKTGNVSPRTPKERFDLELHRWQLFQMVLEHLFEKYTAANRTQVMFREIAQGRKGFILFLRGFGQRALYFEAATVTQGDCNEMVEKKRLIQKLAPVPVVFISNPVDSGPLSLVMAKMNEETLGFRVESGAAWEVAARTLISAASYIVVHNPKMTPGVVTEIEMVRQLGRLERTYFHSPKQAEEALGVKDSSFNALTDGVIEHMRVTTKGCLLEPVSLPEPTCRWIEGSARMRGNMKIKAICNWIERLSQNRATFSADLELDGYASLLADLLLLECIDRLPPVLLELSQVFQSFNEDHLKDAVLFAKGYSKFANQLQAAWEKTSASLPDIERTAEALSALGE